jgi:Mitochondrial PGP phosphatase
LRKSTKDIELAKAEVLEPFLSCETGVTMNLNLSGSLNVFKLITKPTLCLPHHTVSTFADLPIPLSNTFDEKGRKANIKVVVLDKDDCFAYPDSNDVYEPYKVCCLQKVFTIFG